MPPPSSLTRSRPSSSMPSAVPRPPSQVTTPAGEGVAGAPGVEEPVGGLREPALQRGQDGGEHGGDVLRRAAQRARAVAQLRREVVGAQGDVDADPEDRPALPRPRLGEDAGDLAPVEQDVVGPLDRRRGADRVGDRDARGDREQRRDLAQHERHRAARAAAATSTSRPWRPRPATWWSVVTSVPCGAPAAASSRARSFVEPVSRRCRWGVPSVMRCGPRRRAAGRARRAPSPR